MPILQTTREIKEIDLDTIPGGKINVYTSLLARDVQALMNKNKGSKEADNIIFPLTLLIKDWNLQDALGNVLPVVESNVEQIDMRDIMKVYKEVNMKGFLEMPQSVNGDK